MPKENSTLNVFIFLWPYLWTKQSFKQKCKFLVYVVATIVTTFAVVSVPVLLKYVVDALNKKGALFGLQPIIIVVAYASLWTITKIIDRLRHQSSFPLIANVIHGLCFDLFSHLHKLSTRFHGDRESGRILNTVSRTRYAIADFTGSVGQTLLPIVLQVVLASVCLTYFYGIYYGAILIVMLILYAILSQHTAEKIVVARQRQNQEDGCANAYIVDSILNAETVKYFEMAEWEANQARIQLRAKESADVASLMADAKVHQVQNAIIGAAVVFLTLISGMQVMQGKLAVSDFVMINGFVLMFMDPLSMLGYSYRQAKQSLTHLESAIELLQTPIEIKDKAHAPVLHIEQGEIRFEHVQFSYLKERPILSDVSFTVAPGTTTAIVGTSGSGKSTISRLLYRLYEIDSGNIIIDNQNITAVTQKSLATKLGIVPQDTVLFNDTLRNNICYGGIEVDETELKSVIRMVQLDDFINTLPNKLETVVGERGLKLSGGERQRVAIARMVIRKPSIMIFDEATSALDQKTEHEIQQCLNLISKNISTIIIAHRLATVRHADQIIVLENGVIVERGTHEELVQLGQRYCSLLAKQS